MGGGPARSEVELPYVRRHGGIHNVACFHAMLAATSIDNRETHMDLGLSGKVAVVSGGSRGIGKAIARQLAREGADVAILARDMAVAEAAAHEIAHETGRHLQAFKTDTGEDAAVKNIIAAVAKEFGRIDILVNCAAAPGGYAKPPLLAEITNDDFWVDMNVKVLGYLRTARETVPHMKRNGWGRIINVSGLAARSTGSTIGSIRNVSVAALTKNLADELGPAGINVTCVHPGITRTEKTPGLVERNAKAQNVSAADAEKAMGSKYAIGRFVDAEEIADIVAFLASPRSVAINGDAIATAGGVKGLDPLLSGLDHANRPCRNQRGGPASSSSP